MNNLKSGDKTQQFHNTRTAYSKAKVVPLHGTKALVGEEEYLLLILDLGTRWG
jgi:hypothetical protein